MFTPKPDRDKAAEFLERGQTANGGDQASEFGKLERSSTTLTENAQWMSDNQQNILHPSAAVAPDSTAQRISAEEDHVLRCLGAALIMQWNALPTKLRKELFDKAGSMGDLLDTDGLRGQIARFIHKHKDETSGGADLVGD